MAETLDSVKEYYGKILQKSDDLKTNACCTGELPDKHLREALSKVHSEVLAKYYGCGLVLPEQLKGCRILDLGCGAGRDVYVLSQFVGEDGFVIGVDMTEEQLAVARSHEEWHREKYGFSKSNVEFRQGYIEKLDELNIESDSIDIVVSNCVINLSPDKEAVLKEVYRILKPGGELYFSDVYSDRRITDDLRKDPVLWGECLSGALYWNDFEHLSQKCGFVAPRVVKTAAITIENAQIEEKIGHIKFLSITYRLFKLPDLEPDCEDYGQTVSYKGTMEHQASAFVLDSKHTFEANKVVPVCGNTWMMLKDTRFADHFDFNGDFSTHMGIFAGCGSASIDFESADEGCCAPSKDDSSSSCCPPPAQPATSCCAPSGPTTKKCC